jgi:RNA polymerase sigma-70 factor (ECF subfamily)
MIAMAHSLNGSGGKAVSRPSKLFSETFSETKAGGGALKRVVNHAAAETQNLRAFFCHAPDRAHVFARPAIRVNTHPTRAAARAASAAGNANADGDDACALRAREGDPDAMESLVMRHRDAVARLLWRFAHNRADLDDLVQETFLRMVRGLGGWRTGQPFAHWLLRIATNVGRDYFRRQSVRRRHMAEPDNADAPPPGRGTAVPEAIDPADNPAARAASSEVKEILAGLPPDDRALLTLHYLENHSLAEIAAQFGWTVTAAKLRAWRARGRLRARLKTLGLF